MTTTPHQSERVATIRPETGLALPNLAEVWEYRDLLYFLVRRDFLVRYKQALAGPLWALLQPIGYTVVFSVFLGRVAGVPSTHGIPYPLFALSGLAMWIFFSTALQRSAESTISSAELLSKVYFPRVLIPLSALLASTIDFVVSLTVVIAALFLYGNPPGWEILLLPVAVLLAVATTLGGGLWFSALFVRYRDIRQLLAFIILAGMFVTPVVYPFDLIPSALQPIYALNPLVGVLEFYRWTLFGFLSAPVVVVLIPIATSIVTVISGAIYFRVGERTFADVI